MKLILPFFLLIFNFSFGQSTFQLTYGDSLNDYGLGVIKTIDGKYCIIGSKGPLPKTAIIVNLVDSTGNSIWTKEIDRDSLDWPQDIIQTPDRGFAITGCTSNSLNDTSNGDIFLMKLDSIGNLEFFRTYGFYRFDNASKIILNPSGGYYLFCHSMNINGSVSALLLKLDESGNQIFANITATASANNYQSGFLSSNNKIFALGYCERNLITSYNRWDNYISQFDTNGNLIWTKRYDSGFDEGIYDIIPSDNGGFISCGHVDSISHSNFTICSYDSSGNILWSKQYGHSKNCWSIAIERNGNDQLILAGRMKNNNTRDQFSISRFTNNGTFISSFIYGDTTGKCQPRGLITDTENSIIAIGYIVDDNDPNGQEYFLKLDSTGFSGCQQFPITLLEDTIIFSDSLGSSSQFVTLYDTLLQLTIKTSNLVSNDYCMLASVQPSLNSGMFVYPNPTTGNFKIEIGNYGQHSIDVFNSIGQKVMQTTFGEDFVNLDLSNYSPGIYYYKVDGSMSGKIILTQ